MQPLHERRPEPDARSTVGAGAVPARVGGHGDLAEGGGVADGAGALEGGAARARHDHVAGAAVLALLPARRARVLVLAVLADVVSRAAEKEREPLTLSTFSMWDTS